MNVRRFAVAISAAVLTAGLGGAAPALATTATCGGSGAVATQGGTLADGATYQIQCPAGSWNGTLLLYSHGYVSPGGANPARDAGDPVTAAWLLGHGYALAGSSYASTGWAIEQALPDQIATLDVFGSAYGGPQRTVAWGHSLGGIITAGLVQRYPDRFAGALPMCGVLAGGVGQWNSALDAAFAFQQLVAPSVQVAHISNPYANLAGAEAAVAAAQQTPQGRARIALSAALGDTPGWFTPLSPEPAPDDYAAQEANQYQWDAQVDFPFIFAFRAELEARAGGNPSWNTGVDYTADRARSANRTEVIRLYQAAGLSLTGDLETLERADRINADPAAVGYLRANISFDGNLSIPVLTVHTTGDGLVVPEDEQAYRAAVDRAGSGPLLRQVFVHRAGHCAFTPAETVTALRALLDRVDTGKWDQAALQTANLDAAATALGPDLNIYALGGAVRPTGPAFVDYNPSRFPRPDETSPTGD